MHLLTTVAWYSTWSSIVSDLHNHTNAARRPSPLRHSHPCMMSPTYTRSVFEGRFELLRPSVQGTPSPTTHSGGLLLLRVGSLTFLCTYLQPWRGTARGLSGLHNHTIVARRPQRAMQTVLCKRPPTASNNLYRGRNCCTTHVANATDMFS